MKNKKKKESTETTLIDVSYKLVKIEGIPFILLDGKLEGTKDNFKLAGISTDEEEWQE